MGFIETVKNLLNANNLASENAQLKETINKYKINDVAFALQKLEETQNQTNQYIQRNTDLVNQINSNTEELTKLEKQVRTNQKKLSTLKEIVKRINTSVEQYYATEKPFRISLDFLKSPDLDGIEPQVELPLHCMDMKDLKKAYRENEKQINELTKKYTSWYTTKANKSIYALMVIALKAELQNILYNLKYDKLEKSIEDVKAVTAKYYDICATGNQSISSTMKKFIGEEEYLFINAVKIEYNYYVKKEQAKQEQMAIREQMKQEEEERKALEAEKKKVEKEEEKYLNEIEKIKANLNDATDESSIEEYKKRLLELEGLLSDVAIKKDEIVKLQNGKAGTVYVISNLGAFGPNVFKVGMTRRINPEDRIRELSNASVPFKFDIHSFIFSEDAVAMESKLHELLNDKRVNKVNLRKEFFNTTIDELESLVQDVEPTAEFKRTMVAEEFNQSISSDGNYVSITQDDDDEEEEE